MSTPKILLVFLMLGLAHVLGVFISSWGSFPISDFYIGLAVCCLIMTMEAILVLVLVKSNVLKKFLFLIFSLVNSYYFVFVLTSWSRWEFLAYFILVGFLFLISVTRKNIGEAALLSGFLILIPFCKSFIENISFVEKKSIDNVVQSSLYKKNLYIIGIDGMVSNLALKRIYNVSNSVAYDWLEKNGFQLYDIHSAGNETLTSYSTLLTGEKNSHYRVARPYFNGSKESKFYSTMRSAGYKIQFFYESDYFGVDVGRLDSFIPKSSTLAICSFIDKRWAFYFCGWIEDFGFKFKSDLNLSEKIKFYKKNASIRADEKWVSINHIWFPGHTLGNYNAANSDEFDNFRKYYLDSQYELKYTFIDLVNFIKERDPDPIIIFLGDHGGYALRSKDKFTFKNYNENEMIELLELDARSALLAVYPKDFCKGEINIYDTTDLFLRFAKCLEGF